MNDRFLLPPLMGMSELPDAATTEAHWRAVADPDVRRLASTCVGELARLVKEEGFAHFLHAAVMGAAAGGTPAQWLEIEVDLLRAAIRNAAEGRILAESRERTERDRRRPLADAVAKLSTAASTERDVLLRRLQDLTRPNAGRKSRVQELRSAGLTEEQIALVNPKSDDPEQQAQELRARLEVLDHQLSKCLAYSMDPLHDPALARGLGLDDLVDAQLALTAEAA